MADDPTFSLPKHCVRKKRCVTYSGSMKSVFKCRLSSVWLATRSNSYEPKANRTEQLPN